MPLFVLLSDIMHIGILVATNVTTANRQFTIFYNTRVSPFEFLIPTDVCKINLSYLCFY